MTFPSHPSSVPLFRSLEGGTMEQTLNQRNNPRNVGGTFSLKALANKVLERNKDGNKPGTEASNSVPLHPQSSSPCGTNAEVGCKVETDSFLYDFEERLAIAEYDGEASPVQAHSIAYLDAFISILTHFAEDEPDYQNWLKMNIHVALERLEDQSKSIFD